MRENEHNQFEELEKDLIETPLPRVNADRCEEFKRKLKSDLLFEYNRKIERKTSTKKIFQRFLTVFNHAIVSVFILPLLVLGGVGTYAYYSPAVYNGHILYPVRLSIENIEYGSVDALEDKVLKDLKLAERRMSEVESKLLNDEPLDQKTLALVANHTLSAVDNAKSIDSEVDKRRLKSKIEEFSSKQLELLSSLQKNDSLGNDIIAYQQKSSVQGYEDIVFPQVIERQYAKQEADSTELSVGSYVFIEGDFGESLLLEDGEPVVSSEQPNALVAVIENNDVLSGTEIYEDSGKIANMERTGGISQVSDKLSDEDMPKEIKTNKIIEVAKDIGEELGEIYQKEIEKRGEGQIDIEQNNQEEALNYIWALSSEIKTIDLNKSDFSIDSHGIRATQGKAENVDYLPRLRFVPSFDRFLVPEQDNEFLIQSKEPFSFYVDPFFVDDLSLIVPAFLHKNNIEIYFTRDNSDPFNSETRIIYDKGLRLDIDRSMTLKFIAVTENHSSPIYTIQISIIPVNESSSKVVEIKENTNKIDTSR